MGSSKREDRSLPRIEVPKYPPDPPLLAAPGYTPVGITFQYEGEDSPRNPDGEPGEYEVTFTLLPSGQTPGYDIDELGRQIVRVADQNLPGDSHLVVCTPETVRSGEDADVRCVLEISVNRLETETGITRIRVEPNDSGRAAKVRVTTTAENFDDAEHKAHFEASSFLSDLAFKLDIPLKIAHTHITESASKSTRTGYVRQFSYRSIANLQEYEETIGVLQTDIRGDAYPALVSIYREALNSDSPFYQILCFCRVIQRLIERLRPRWIATLREHDVALPLYLKDEELPSKGASAENMPEELKGMRFTKAYMNHLRPLRNGIGHVFLEDERDQDSAERSTDELDFTRKAYMHLPVAHHIAREIVEKDFGPSGLARYAFELQARNSQNKDRGEAR